MNPAPTWSFLGPSGTFCEMALRQVAPDDVVLDSCQDVPTALDRVRERFGISEAVILTSGGRIIQSSGGRYAALVPDLPSPTALRQARLAHHYAAIEGNELREDNPDQNYQALRMRVMVPIISSDVREERHYVPGSPDPELLILHQGAGLGRSVPVSSAVSAVVGASDGELTVGQIVAAVATLTTDLGNPTRISEIGVEADGVAALTEDAFNDVCTPGNPRPASREDIEALYRSLL